MYPIAWAFNVFYALCGFVVGGIVGWPFSVVVSRILSRRVAPIDRYQYTLYLPVMTAAMIGSCVGLWRLVRHEDESRPRILYTTGRFLTATDEALLECVGRIEPTAICGNYPEQPRVSVPTLGVEVACPVLGRVTIADSKGNVLDTPDIGSSAPFRDLLVVPLGAHQAEGPALAILARLPYWAERDVLLVYDSHIKLIYKELLRAKRPHRDSMWTCSQPARLIVNSITVAAYRL
jgi:multisubunit Na+/H+ antiporter MnhE subunit